MLIKYNFRFSLTDNRQTILQHHHAKRYSQKFLVNDFGKKIRLHSRDYFRHYCQTTRNGFTSLQMQKSHEVLASIALTEYVRNVGKQHKNRNKQTTTLLLNQGEWRTLTVDGMNADKGSEPTVVLTHSCRHCIELSGKSLPCSHIKSQ